MLRRTDFCNSRTTPPLIEIKEAVSPLLHKTSNRRSGVQRANRFLDPKSPSRPYLSSSSAYVNLNRELVSVKVGPESHGLAAPNSSNNALPNRLLSPLELINTPSVPFPSVDMERPFMSTIKGAISFLEWNGYICRPRSFQSPTQPSSESTPNESSIHSASKLDITEPSWKDKK